MVIHDAATFPGIVLTCRIIGILQIEQKSKGKAERNDRLFAVPRRSHSEQGLRDVRDLSKPIQQELEKFFVKRHDRAEGAGSSGPFFEEALFSKRVQGGNPPERRNDAMV